MKLENLTWIFSVSTVVTTFLGLSVLALGICWWLIFKKTVRRFNAEGDRHD